MVEMARLFMIGRSQMVKLPKAFQFAGEDEVSIGSGERGTTVILSTGELLRALPEAERVNVV